MDGWMDGWMDGRIYLTNWLPSSLPPSIHPSTIPPKKTKNKGTRAYLKDAANLVDALALLLLHASAALRFFLPPAATADGDAALRSSYHLLSALAALMLWCVVCVCVYTYVCAKADMHAGMHSDKRAADVLTDPFKPDRPMAWQAEAPVLPPRIPRDRPAHPHDHPDRH